MNNPSLSIGDARKLVADLMRPRAAWYWLDLIVSLGVGYGCASYYLTASSWNVWRIVCLAVSAFALYRAGSFMHEVVHFRRGEVRGFRIAYDLLAGIPMLTPSYFYESHIAHHNTHYYGTGGDGEYLPLGNGPLRNIAFFLSQVFFQPAVVVIRFAILTPISFLHPRLRTWVLEYTSSFKINLRYRHEIPENAPRKWWAFMDVCCCIRAQLIFLLVIFGVTPWTRIPLLYSIAICVLTLNYVRTLSAHRYRSDGETMSHEEQFFDSTNIRGMPIVTELLCPLGLRYHALHHLFPALPYHNLGAAHERLMRDLPADSGYREVEYPGFWAVVVELVGNSRSAARSGAAGSRSWFANRRDRLQRREGRVETVVPPKAEGSERAEEQATELKHRGPVPSQPSARV